MIYVDVQSAAATHCFKAPLGPYIGVEKCDGKTNTTQKEDISNTENKLFAGFVGGAICSTV